MRERGKKGQRERGIASQMATSAAKRVQIFVMPAEKERESGKGASQSEAGKLRPAKQ